MMALPGTLAAAAAAVSALRAAESLSWRDLISDLESAREVVSSERRDWRVVALASAEESWDWRRRVSLEAAFWVASSALRVVMRSSAAGVGG